MSHGGGVTGGMLPGDRILGEGVAGTEDDGELGPSSAVKMGERMAKKDDGEEVELKGERGDAGDMEVGAERLGETEERSISTILGLLTRDLQK